MDELLDFALGLFVAFLASVPSGPVNLAVFRASLNGQRITAFLIAAGGALAEMVYCIAGIWGASYIPKGGPTAIWLQTLSVPILVALGISALRRQEKKVHEAVESEGPPVVRKRGFFVGAGLNFLNPVLVPFWALVVNLLINKEWMSGAFVPLVFFTLGVFCGTLGLLFLVAEIAHARRKAWSEASLMKVNKVIGFVFLAFALYQGYRVTWIWIENWQVVF